MASVVEALTMEQFKELLGEKELMIAQLSRHIAKLDAEIARLTPPPEAE